MTEMAKWWTTQAGGLLGPVSPTSTASSYGEFTWTPYAQLKYMTNSNPCTVNSDALFLDAAKLWARGSGAYTKTDTSNRRLLVLADERQCTLADGTLLGNSGLTSGDSPVVEKVGFPGWGKMYVQVATEGQAKSIQRWIHEMGHSFGLNHAVGGLTCTQGLDGKKGLDGKTYGFLGEVADCTRSSIVGVGYGDSTNVMGNAGAWQTTGLNGYQKRILGIPQPGSGLVSVTSPSSGTYVLDAKAVQGIRVVDSASNPASEYAIDLAATSDCTVRVLRVYPSLPVNPSIMDYIAAQPAWQASMTSGMWEFGGATPDSFKVNLVHAGSTETCLAANDTYTSWSGHVMVSVLSVAADRSSAKVQVTYEPTMPMAWITMGPDVTGDGRGEVYGIDRAGALWMYPATATGGLGTPVLIGTGFAGQRVFGPGDINSDGKADIIGITADGNLWLYPGTGVGPVGARVQIGVGWTGWQAVPVGDINGDKRPDLLGVDPAGRLYHYFGDGAGHFTNKAQCGVGWTGWGLYAGGDLNGDGKNDILGVDPAGQLFRYLGDGTGLFSNKLQIGSGWNVYTLASGADLNGDGLADILGRYDKTGALYIYKGQGVGFALPVQIASGW